MGETEIDVETTEVQTETFRFCDACGRYGDDVEIVTLHRDVTLITTKFGNDIEQALDTTHRAGPGVENFRVETAGEIDACEACLRETFNEEVVDPIFMDEPLTEQMRASEKGLRERARAWADDNPRTVGIILTVLLAVAIFGTVGLLSYLILLF